MSLLDDVSIVVTPNGYKAGTLYGVLPVPTEGSELVSCGDFDCADPDAVWITGTGWGVAGGTANCDGSQSGNTDLTQSIATSIGKQYKITYTVSNYSAGSIKIRLNSGNVSLSKSSNGTFTEVLSGQGGGFSLRADLDFIGSIDNVSVKEYTASDMDVTRATAATRVDENGLVNYAEVLGSEIADITSGTPVDASNWANVTSNSVDFTGLGASGVSYYNNVATGLVSGETYIISLTISNFSGSSDLGVSGQGGVPTSLRFINDGTATKVFTSDGSNIRIFGRAGTNTATFSNFSIKKVHKNNVPRIDYTGGGCPHIFAEPQRTNLLTYSEDFSNATWTKLSGGTGSLPVITPNNVISPDGTTNADKIVFDAGSGTTSGDQSQITDSVSFPNNTTGTASIYLKGENGGEQLVFRGVADGTYTLITLTTDWQRFSTTENSGTNTDAITFGIRQSVSGLGVINSSATVYAWGSQIEEGSYATSYIPTSGSSVTRNQDQFSRDGISSLINSTEGVFFGELNFGQIDSAARYISVSDGTTNNRAIFGIEANESKIRYYFSNGGSLVVNKNYLLTDISIFNKVAIKWKLNDFALWLNGVEVASVTSGSTPSAGTFNKLNFTSGGSVQPFFGKVKQLQVYNTALTDMQLIQLTGTAGTDFYESYSEMAETLTYTIQ
jgi:hypothetical protein